MDIQEAAARALEDPEYAQKVLVGEEDVPEVREAIIADLYADADEHPEGAPEAETEGFSSRFAQHKLDMAGLRQAACFVRYYPKGGGTSMKDWGIQERVNVRRLAGQ